MNVWGAGSKIGHLDCAIIMCQPKGRGGGAGTLGKEMAKQHQQQQKEVGRAKGTLMNLVCSLALNSASGPLI